jgi:hypothetical protein
LVLAREGAVSVWGVPAEKVRQAGEEEEEEWVPLAIRGDSGCCSCFYYFI